MTVPWKGWVDESPYGGQGGDDALPRVRRISEVALTLCRK
jgi:hypothetical protein